MLTSLFTGDDLPLQVIRRKEKVKRKNISCLLLLTAAIAAMATGCGTGGDKQVIGEKTESSAVDESADGESGGVEDETAGNHELSVPEQVQAPEHYKTEVKEKGMILSADAPVTVPELKQAVIKNAKSVNYTKEEYEQVKKTLEKTLGVTWEEEKVNTLYFYENEEETAISIESGTAADSNAAAAGTDRTVLKNGDVYGESTNTWGKNEEGSVYQLTYRTGTDDFSPPISLIWLTKIYNDDRHSEKPSVVYGNDDEAAVSRAGKAGEFEKRAEELLKELGIKGYKIYDTRWREAFFTAGGESISNFQYRITFTPFIDGVGVPCPSLNLPENASLEGPYIDVVYNEDGTLTHLKLIGKEELEVSANDGTFLLPFEAIHELFEQYCKDSYGRNSESRLQSYQKDEKAPAGWTEPVTLVNVSKVKMEYAFIGRENRKKATEQELIPVWNFYGNVSRGQEKTAEAELIESASGEMAQQDGIILSIRADDGRILWE